MSGLGSASVIRANSRHLPLADNSVDLVVTSPPYFALRSYQDGGEHYAGQIGDEPTPAEFVASLLEVTAECVRVLKPSGSLWVNLGDKYAGGGGQWDKDERPDPQKRRAASGSIGTGGRTFGLRQKSLIGIPWRYALACIDDLGLILRAEVIWSKPNGLPESVTDRVRRSHETWFHFTLEPRYFSAVDEIRETYDTADRKGPRRSYPAGSASSMSADGDHQAMTGPFAGLPLNPLGKLPGSVWTVPTEPLRVPDHLGIDHFAAFPTEWPKRIIAGWSPAGVCVECGEGRRPVVDKCLIVDHVHKQNRVGKMDMRDRDGQVWEDDGVRGSTRTVGSTSATITSYACACPPMLRVECAECGHLTRADVATAGFYVRNHATKYPGHAVTETPAPADTRPAVVLDPFGGTGTTAMVAKALGRHGITVDMSADYCRLAEWRTNDRNQLAKVLGHAKTEAPDEHQLDLFGEATA